MNDSGVPLAYHHHMGTIVQSQEDTERLIDNTSDTVKLLIDTGHMMVAGGDFEKIAKDRDGKQAANLVINELFGRLNKAYLSIKDSPISTNQLGNILDLISKGDISGKIAKDLFEIVWNEGGNPSEIVNDRGMKQVTDTNQIETAVDKIMNENPDQVAKAKENPKLAGWFVGQVMKATGGKANPKAVNEIIAKKLQN